MKDFLRFCSASLPQKIWLLEQSIHADPVSQARYNSFLEAGNMVALRYWGRPGCYLPAPLGDDMAVIRLSWRYGLNVSIHTLLHELVHAEQDRRGLLITDKNTDGLSPHELRERYIQCEKEAGLEAIAASWRLYQAGYVQAWKGALASREWCELAMCYHEHQTIDDAAWMKSKACRFYAQRAEKLFVSNGL